MLKGVNWVGVVAALIFSQALGLLWYGVVFEEPWTRLARAAPGLAAPADQTAPMLLGVANTLLALAGLGWLIDRLAAKGWAGGARIGLFAGACFALTTSGVDFIYGVADPGLVPIDFGYLLLLYTVGGAMIGGVKLPTAKAVRG